jgi:cytochrome c biogenesis protein CcmG, thiol:disulfide interchange protein DsbE
MPAGVRDRLARLRRGMAEHKVTTAVFGVSGAAILALGIFAGVSGSGSAGPAAASAGSAGSSAGTSSAQAAHGQQAPAFDLAALGHPGGHVSLGGYAGRPLIVNFFASWCVPCRQETPLMAQFYKSQHGAVTVIGVDTNDSSASALKFTRNYGVSYPVASDPAATTAGSFGVSALPQTFFLNAQHRVVDRVYGAVTKASLARGVNLMDQPASS